MADGMEVVLGFSPGRFAEVSGALGVFLPRSDEEFFEMHGRGTWEDVVRGTDVALRGLLEDAHRATLLAAGFRPSARGESWQTPAGERRLSPFSPQLFWDPSDTQEEPSAATFGVALSGRYSPVLLDWRDPSGALWPVRMDASFRLLCDLARREVSARVPVFASADLHVVLRHY